MERLKEPSTWAGLAVILQSLKLVFPVHALLLDGLSAALASGAVMLREGVKRDDHA